MGTETVITLAFDGRLAGTAGAVIGILAGTLGACVAIKNEKSTRQRISLAKLTALMFSTVVILIVASLLTPLTYRWVVQILWLLIPLTVLLALRFSANKQTREFGPGSEGKDYRDFGGNSGRFN